MSYGGSFVTHKVNEVSKSGAGVCSNYWGLEALDRVSGVLVSVRLKYGVPSGLGLHQ